MIYIIFGISLYQLINSQSNTDLICELEKFRLGCHIGNTFYVAPTNVSWRPSFAKPDKARHGSDAEHLL